MKATIVIEWNDDSISETRDGIGDVCQLAKTLIAKATEDKRRVDPKWYAQYDDPLFWPGECADEWAWLDHAISVLTGSAFRCKVQDNSDAGSVTVKLSNCATYLLLKD